MLLHAAGPLHCIHGSSGAGCIPEKGIKGSIQKFMIAIHRGCALSLKHSQGSGFKWLAPEGSGLTSDQCVHGFIIRWSGGRWWRLRKGTSFPVPGVGSWIHVLKTVFCHWPILCLLPAMKWALSSSTLFCSDHTGLKVGKQELELRTYFSLKVDFSQGFWSQQQQSNTMQ